MKSHFIAATLLLKILPVEGVLRSDGSCPIFAFVPLTFGDLPYVLGACDDCLNLGYSHMAAASMAVKHFNERDPIVVKELANLQNCTVQLNLNAFNTETYTHRAAESLVQQPEIPCAVVGAFNDIPNHDLTALSAAYHFPLTSHRGYDIRPATFYASDYTQQIYPDLVSSAHYLVQVLLQKGRTNYIAIVTGLSLLGAQVRETVSTVMDNVEPDGMRYESFSYNALSSPATSDTAEVDAVFRDVYVSGFRTIVLNVEFSFYELHDIARAATGAGLTNGDYLWVIFGDFDPSIVYIGDSIVNEFLAGALWLTALDPFYYTEFTDNFSLAWYNQTEEDVKTLNALNPLEDGDPGFYEAKASFFQDFLPEYGSSFMYDAVIATGIGACIAEASAALSFTSEDHVAGIRSASFEGASGYVRFCGSLAEETNSSWSEESQSPCKESELPGSRDPATPLFVVLNLGADGVLNPTDLCTGLYCFPFPEAKAVYADGSNEPPLLLRKQPEQNYLSNGIRIFGFTLMTVALLLSVVTAAWILFHHKDRVILAAQPYFLYLLCLGSAAEAVALFPLLFDESQGWSVNQLSRACMAIPWLFCLGYIVTYGALFSKLWRVNRVLQFTRRNIKVSHVVWPSALLAFLAVLVLTLWTALDSMEWIRKEIDDVTGESIGTCDNDHFIAFIVPLVLLMLIPSLLTFVMSYKTKDVDDVYAESYWIFIMVLVQLEVTLFALPMVAILRNSSSNDAKSIGLTLLIWTFPMSTLVLIIGPKVGAFYRAKWGMSSETQGPKRGERASGGVRISGLNSGTGQHVSSEERHAAASSEISESIPSANL